MGFDQQKRELERQVSADPDDEKAIASLARMESRSAVGRLEHLRRYIGKWVYVEGARMNYLGLLAGVTGTVSGDPADLLFGRLFRIGDWGRNGPADNHAMELTASAALPQWIPWQAVDGFGLAPSSWDEWIRAAT